MNYYQRAIRVISDARTNQEAYDLLVEIAIMQPSLIIKADEKRKVRTVPEWVAEYSDFIKREQYIGAIKFLRTQTGTGLKNAKEFTDNYRINGELDFDKL